MDNSNLLWAFQALLGAFCTVIWSGHVDTKRRAEKATEDLAAYKTTVASQYATSAELRESIQTINRFLESLGDKMDGRFDKLEAKIDQKADKHVIPHS